MSSFVPEKKTESELECSPIESETSAGKAPVVSSIRFIIAAILALVADIISLIFPPSAPVVDLITAPLLIVVLGFHWEIIPVIAVELVPGLGIAPSWIIFVIYLYCRFVIKKNK